MKRTHWLTAIAVAGLAASVSTAYATSNVTVTESDVEVDAAAGGSPSSCADTETWCRWTRGTGTATFVEKGTPPAGNGYLEISTPDGNAKAYLFSFEFAGMPLRELESISFHTYRDPASTGSSAQVPSLNIEIMRDGTTGYAVLVWEPVYAAGGSPGVQTGTWQHWTASSGPGWWSPANEPIVTGSDGDLGFASYTATLADVQEALPEAVIVGLGVNGGGGNQGMIGGVDLLEVNGTTFDFEAPPTGPRTIDDCKNGGWSTFASPVFRNQGQCVSSVVAARRAGT